jgi:hypothetical protein
MKIMIRQMLLLVIHFVLIFSAQNVYATFGESCSFLPIVDSEGYLVKNTAYGYIQQNLDMKTYVDDACVDEGSDFRFCIKN